LWQRLRVSKEGQAMNNSYPDRLRGVKQSSMRLANAVPDVMQAFEGFHQTAVASRALDTKIKELMALAISVTHGCDDCIAHHVHDAIDAGATREEITDTLGVAVLMGGGPGMIYASHAMEAMEQFLDS
jgi:AhpD family alkylhydroperoxidase